MKRLAVAFAVLVSAPAYADKPMSCESLAGLRLPDTTITTATVVPSGAFNPAIVTTACRVAGSIKPTSDSDIRFEVWMPTEGWNGKFLSAGEGGYAGSINYGGIGGALRRGYAGGSTDTGHVGGTADFAPGHPEKVADFGWRGKHLQAARSKDIIRAFYGKSVKHSYFSSCSNGGRQALMEIQRFPEDYDGVIVGAPANNWTHHFAGFHLERAGAVQYSRRALVATKLAGDPGRDAAHVRRARRRGRRRRRGSAALQVRSGVDRLSCRYRRPELSHAAAGDRGAQDHAGAAQSAHWKADLPRLLHQRRRRGRELGGVDHRPAGRGASVQAFFGNAFFGRIVEEIPAPGVWDLAALRFRQRHGVRRPQDRAHHERHRGGSRPLHATRNRRGKIIMWHGWEDPAISGADAVDYYRQVVRENDDSDGLLPPLHGAGDAPLRRRARTQRLRPEPAAGAAAQQLAEARRPQRAGAVGGGRRGAGEDRSR